MVDAVVPVLPWPGAGRLPGPVVVEEAAAGTGEAGLAAGSSPPPDPPESWAERHGIDTARRLVDAENLADAVAREITPDNTIDTYAKSWRVWERFCADQNFPLTEGTRGSLVAFAVCGLLRGTGVSQVPYGRQDCGGRVG
ncbi:hypothetical protein [Streptomyces cyaneofuscatus]|uniref:hypothetical protein n=1 Tax=Streptomyces cyaneofuscatus TaxID=66883 RepID=UPI00365073EC